MDEMLYTALRYRWVGETSAAPNTYDEALNGSRLFGILDQRMDGKLTRDELTGPVGTGLLAHFDQIDMKHQGSITPDELAMALAYARHHHHASGSATPEDPNAPTSAAAKPGPTARAAPAKPETLAASGAAAAR
jgi:hypothetical protein